MVGFNASPVDDGSYLRKLRKPLIEKKRRERINTSIGQLKKMLTQSRPEIDSDTKLDKAEILELTVNHLTSKQCRPTTSYSYSKGFDDCSRETIQYLAARGILDPVSLSRLSSHLQYISEAKPTQQTTVPVSMETTRPSPRKFCSTPLSRGILAYPCNVSITTTPSMSHSYMSYSSSSGDDSSCGSDVSLLGNIISEEKPWRPW